MIYPGQVQTVAEKFLIETLTKWPKMVDALISHPKWKEWCVRIADELSKQEIIAEVEDKPFNPIKEISVWAASYAQHTLDRVEANYFGITELDPTEIQKSV